MELVKQFDMEEGTIFLQNITFKKVQKFNFNQFKNPAFLDPKKGPVIDINAKKENPHKLYTKNEKQIEIINHNEIDEENEKLEDKDTVIQFQNIKITGNLSHMANESSYRTVMKGKIAQENLNKKEYNDLLTLE